MTQERLQPQVDLLFNPNELSAQAHRQVTLAAAESDSVAGALNRAMFLQHTYMVAQMREQLSRSSGEVTADLIFATADGMWRSFMPRFIRVSGPEISLVYAQALRSANAGVVPQTYISALAEQHAIRLGTYFHESSRDAMVQGFNSLVNRKVPARAAADQVLRAYGLSPRQMNSMVALAPAEKVTSSIPSRLKSKVENFIRSGVRQRIDIFSGQEAHNLDQQAEQIAWLWNVEHGNVSARAEKIWITAKDEKVCKVCGPMHGRVAKVADKFELPDGQSLWVPSPHPNCRCKVRFRVPRHLTVVEKADRPYYGDDADERDTLGRFAAKNRPGPRFKEAEPEEDEARQMAQSFFNRAPELDRPIKMDAPVDMSGSVSMSGLGPVSMGAVNMSTETPTMETSKPVGMSVEQGVKMREDIKVSLRNRTMHAIEMFSQKLLLPDTRPKIGHRGVVQLPTPVYRVIVPWEEMDSEGKLSFNHDQHWVASPKTAAQNAEMWREDEIAQAITFLNEEPYYGELRTTGPHAGHEMHYSLNEDQIADLVWWVASQGKSKDLASAMYQEDDPLMDVEWYGEEGERQELWEDEMIPFSEVAKHFSLKPEMFEVSVAVITEGHESSLGGTVFNPDDKRAAVTTSGDYRVSTRHKGSTILEDAHGMTFYHLAPADTEAEWLYGPSDGRDDWNE